MPQAGDDMASIDLKYVKAYRDRHLTMRYYFRRNGKTLGKLPGAPGSAEFMAAYEGFMGHKVPARVKEGTFGRLVTEYYASVEFANLKPNTKSLYKQALEPLAAKYGDRPGATLDQEAVRKILQKIGAERPGMANLTRAVMRLLMTYAVATGWRKDNPVIGIRRYKGGTRHTWTDAELSQFEAFWPLGTRQRLGYALLLYTAQRVGDVMKMQRTDIVDGRIRVEQQKTGAKLEIPIAPELADAMKAGPTCLRFLIGNAVGGQMKGEALTMMMRKAVAKAGLDPRCKAHGLRKAAMRRLAEDGATDKEMASVSGHKSLKEIERYTEAANQTKLADAALGKLKRRT